MKNFLLFTVIVMVFIPAVSGQSTVTIGSTTCSTQTTFLPWNHYWEYGEAQYGIPAPELAPLGASLVEITKIGWYSCLNPPSSGYSLNVYIDQAPSTYVLGTLAQYSYENTNLVATNKSSLTVNGNILFLDLDTPFVYTPGNALIITVCETARDCGDDNHYWAGNGFQGNGYTRYYDTIIYDCNMLTNDGGYNATANAWATTWFEFSPVGELRALTMLPPDGSGSGTVLPPPGTIDYPENVTVNISATPNADSLFDHWKLDGALFSTDQNTTILMDTDHTVQAFFNLVPALALPLNEDFTGLAIGALPPHWDQTHTTQWGAYSTSWAGGIAPEMRLHYDPWAVGQIKLITPKLDGATATHVICSFKHHINKWSGSFVLRVQTSIDNGTTWQNQWSENVTSTYTDEVYIDLNGVAGSVFQVAFVFDGDLVDLMYWCIDDVLISEPPDRWELDMLNPVGLGAVTPDIGLHDMILNGKELRLGAIPSSTWYAFDSDPGDDCIVFDPEAPADFFVLGPNTAPDFISGGTWADGTWYVSHFDLENSNIYTVDPSDGTMTLVGSSGVSIVSLAYDEVNHILYGASGATLYRVDTSTGAATFIGNFGGSILMVDIAYGDGALYGHCILTDSMYTIDVNTALPTLIGTIGYDTNFAQGMEYDKDNDRLFLAICLDSDETAVAEVDVATGRAFLYGAFLKADGYHEICALAIPYGIAHPWEFDHWKVDGTPYSDDPVTTLVMNANHAAQAVFTTPFEIYTLTMLVPGGAGEGSVTPAPGIHIYSEGAMACLSAVPAIGSGFEYWEVDSAQYSTNPNEVLLMEDDYTVQAIFEPQQPRAIPYFEDFTGVSVGEIPIDWYRSHLNWGVSNTDDAGGVAPEMMFDYGGISAFLLVTPPIDGTIATDIVCRFNHYLRHYGYGYSYDLSILTTTDGGATWDTVWSLTPNDDIVAETLSIDLSAVVGRVFQVAFVVDGDTVGIYNWNIDDIFIGEPQPPPIPTTGVTGIGLLLLALGSLMSFAGRKK